MIRNTFNNFKSIYMDSDKNYYIKRHKYYNSIDEALKDGHRIYKRLKYTAEANEMYKDVSSMICIRQTKGKTAIKTKQKTKGRPKYLISGEKVKPHIHIAIYGTNAPKFTREITDKLNKNLYKNYEEYKNRGFKSNRLFTFDKFKDNYHGAYYIPYMFRQAENCYSFGNMEFNKMKDDFFIVFTESDFEEKIDNMKKDM